MEYGQPYHEPPIPGVPMVRILDENGKQCMQEGYYVHSEKVNYCGAFGDDLTDEQLAENTLHLVAITDQGDWNMKNTVRLIRVTPPHRIEVIGSTREEDLIQAINDVLRYAEDTVWVGEGETLADRMVAMGIYGHDVYEGARPWEVRE